MEIQGVNQRESVLIFTPFGRDAEHVSKVLTGVGFHCILCRDIGAVLRNFKHAGVIIATEEVLSSPESLQLTQALSSQPSWSALPVVAFYGGSSESNPVVKRAVHPLQQYTDLTILRRPVSAPTLVSSVKAAFKDRERQHQIKHSLDAQLRLQKLKDEALAQIQNERTKLQNIFAHVPTPLAILEGPEHRFRFANSLYQDYFLRGKEFLGKTLAEVLPEAAKQGFTRPLDDVYETGQRYVGTNRPFESRKADGTVTQLFLDFVYEPVHDHDGKIETILTFITDVTNQVLATKSIEISANELRTEKAKVDALISESASAISLMRGPDLIFEIVNKKWTELVSPREYIDRRYVDIYPELVGTAAHQSLQDIFITGVPFSARETKLKVTSPAGVLEDQYFDYSNVRILDSEGQPYGVYCHAANVTDHVLAKMRLESAKSETELQAKRADRERAKFEAAFHAVAEGIFIFDSEGNPVFMNDGAAKVFGSASAADVRKRVEYYFERLVLTDLDDNLIPLNEWPVAKALRGESFRDWQIKAHRTDIDEHWIWSSSGELAKQPGLDLTLAVVVLRDITSQKKAELELQSAKSEADRANLTKSYFLANMSHEIRTPLGAILGFTDLLKDRSLNSADRDQFLDTISRNGKGLTRIIDDILDLAKVESGKLEVEKVEFSFFDLLDEILDLFRERTKSKGLYLRMNMAEHIPTRIMSDPTRLRQIFINIIGNAVKFTEQGGITIQVSAENMTDGGFEFKVSVRDTGVGIPPEKKVRLFQPFAQADNTTTRKYGGTGLGLVLSQRLAKALGGEITIEDRDLSEGSVFVITFAADAAVNAANPKAVEKIPAAMDSSITVRPLEGIRTLLADDSPDNLALISRILSMSGAQVETAGNGEEALNRALSETFDIVLMDIQMPVMDGHQATRSLRAAGFEKPIVALTAHAMAEERAMTLASGCNGHLTKPINRTELLNEIRRQLNRA